VLLVRSNRPEEALQHLRDATVEHRLAAGALHALGHANVQLNHHMDAVRYLIEAVQWVDTSLAVDSAEMSELDSTYRSLLKSITSRSEEALAAINRRFLRMLEGKDWKQRISETRRQIEEIMREQGAEGAVDILEATRGDELSDSVARIDRYIRNGLLTLAMDEAHRAIEFSPNYLPVHLRSAEIMMREGRVRQAINKYNTVAKTYLVRGENDRAAAILTQVLEMAPLDISTRESLIELLEAEERWPDVVDQYMDLADTYHQLGNFEAARDTFSIAEKASQRTSAPPDKIVRIKHRMADIDQMRLDFRRAIRNYEEIIQLEPNDERAYRMLVDLNYRQGNQIEAIRHLDHLLSLYAHKRQVNKITQLLEELVTLYGNDTGLRSRLAAIYRQLGRTKDAIVQLDALGELQLEAGMRKEAAGTIRQIIGLNPDGVDQYRRLLTQLGG
jgi:tetratricopeptide (TPR) repeat protein